MTQATLHELSSTCPNIGSSLFCLCHTCNRTAAHLCVGRIQKRNMIVSRTAGLIQVELWMSRSRSRTTASTPPCHPGPKHTFDHFAFRDRITKASLLSSFSCSSTTTLVGFVYFALILLRGQRWRELTSCCCNCLFLFINHHLLRSVTTWIQFRMSKCQKEHERIMMKRQRYKMRGHHDETPIVLAAGF